MTSSKRKISIVVLISVLIGGATLLVPRTSGAEDTKYASESMIESTFRGKSFYLGSNTQVAVIRALDWDKERTVNLPFWLGTGIATPPALLPQKGEYYVISEAVIVRSLGGKEWLIHAGSKLQKPDAVFVTSRTHYKNTGVILPTIVQYAGTRNVTQPDGSKIDTPVLQEVSLPVEWNTKRGPVPAMYARFYVGP